MGEPLHNYDATMKALRILADEHGLAVRRARVTLSTVGLLPALDRLASEAADAEPRDLAARHDRATARALVPINRKYSCEDILDACRRFPLKRREPHHVRIRAARRRERYARGCAPAGPAAGRHQGQGEPASAQRGAGIPFARPSDARVDRFARILAERGVTVSVRKSRGRDIRAACGQLIVEGRDTSARPAPGDGDGAGVRWPGRQRADAQAREPATSARPGITPTCTRSLRGPGRNPGPSGSCR